MGAQKQAEVVPEGFLEEEASLRHLASACLGVTFEPQSQPWADTLSVLSLPWRTLLYLLRPSLAIISHSNSHPACSQN